MAYHPLSDSINKEETRDKDEGKDFDQEVVRDALLNDIEKRTEIHPSLEKIDLIIFSGDVAYNGKKEEYEALHIPPIIS